ncbi:MAG: chromosome segregation ATPase, partial [Granulosicoccus sp.]
MFRDFEKAPSRSSYQLKFILAALAILGLLGAWIAQSNTVNDLKSTQLERDKVNTLLGQRSGELQTAERDIVNLKSEQTALEEAISVGETELSGLRATVAELDDDRTQVQGLLAAATQSKTGLEGAIAGMETRLLASQSQFRAVQAQRVAVASELEQT